MVPEGVQSEDLARSAAEEVRSVYDSDKEFVYDHVTRFKVVALKKATDTWVKIKVNAQRRSRCSEKICSLI